MASVDYGYAILYRASMQNTNKPPRIKPRLKAAPRIRQILWCDFPKDAQSPELWKQRPVIILSYKNTLHGAVTIIPCSTSERNAHDEWACKLHTTIDKREAWAICDKITSVAVSRLSLDMRSGAVRMPKDEFDEILALVLKWLPKLD